jgi:hypothetical protein
VFRRHWVLAVPARATRKGGSVANATLLAGPHGAGRGNSPARDEIVDDGRSFQYRQNRVQQCTCGMETGGAGRKRRAFGFPISPTVLVPLPALKRVLVRATIGAAVRTASQQQHGKTAAMILPRWKRFRSTF